MNQSLRYFVLLFLSLQGAMLLMDPSTRSRLYSTFSSLNSTSIPLLRDLSQHFRLIIALILLPVFIYPRKWVIPKLISLFGYIIYICINFNVMIHHDPSDIKYLVVQLFFLLQGSSIIIDDIQQNKKQDRNDKIKKVPSFTQQKINNEPNRLQEKKKK